MLEKAINLRTREKEKENIIAEIYLCIGCNENLNNMYHTAIAAIANNKLASMLFGHHTISNKPIKHLLLPHSSKQNCILTKYSITIKWIPLLLIYN